MKLILTESQVNRLLLLIEQHEKDLKYIFDYGKTNYKITLTFKNGDVLNFNIINNDNGQIKMDNTDSGQFKNDRFFITLNDFIGDGKSLKTKKISRKDLAKLGDVNKWSNYTFNKISKIEYKDDKDRLLKAISLGKENKTDEYNQLFDKLQNRDKFTIEDNKGGNYIGYILNKTNTKVDIELNDLLIFFDLPLFKTNDENETIISGNTNKGKKKELIVNSFKIFKGLDKGEEDNNKGEEDNNKGEDNERVLNSLLDNKEFRNILYKNPTWFNVIFNGLRGGKIEGSGLVTLDFLGRAFDKSNPFKLGKQIIFKSEEINNNQETTGIVSNYNNKIIIKYELSGVNNKFYLLVKDKVKDKDNTYKCNNIEYEENVTDTPIKINENITVEFIDSDGYKI